MTNFPNRPDHPDFWRLSQILLDNDATQDNATMPFEDRVGQVIDVHSGTYMALERGKHAARAYRPHMRNLTNDQRGAITSAFAAVWLDAFLAGAQYQAAVIAERS